MFSNYFQVRYQTHENESVFQKNVIWKMSRFPNNILRRNKRSISCRSSRKFY